MIDLSFITATIIKQPIIYHQNWMLAGYIFLSGTVVIHSEFLDNYLATAPTLSLTPSTTVYFALRKRTDDALVISA